MRDPDQVAAAYLDLADERIRVLVTQLLDGGPADPQVIDGR
jgi:hypothetical protein